MPSKLHDKEVDRDQGSTERREKRRHKSTRTKRKSSSKDEKSSVKLERSSTLADSSTRRRASMPVPELQRRASSISPRGSKVSLPYPSFSKAHSREDVGSKENVGMARPNIFTPDPTDLQKRRKTSDDEKVVEATMNEATVNGPPSPPLTAMDPAAKVDEKRPTLSATVEESRDDLSDGKDVRVKIAVKTRSSSAQRSPWRNRQGLAGSTISSTHRSKPSTPTKMKPKPATVDDEPSLTSRRKSRSPSLAPSSRAGFETRTASTIDSDSTSIAPLQHTRQEPFSPEMDNESSPPTNPDSSPRTPTPRGTPFPPDSKEQQPVYAVPVGLGHLVNMDDSPMPPPPPPPPAIPFQIPRVDYLMQNGGLPHAVSKSLVFAPDPSKAPQTNPNDLPNPTIMTAQVERIFAPFNNLLENYEKVMSKNGSMAVATGYRSIARRLLDRLEAVFARDISSEVCTCIICETMQDDSSTLEDERGLSWGEILEYVCGRRELPPWPAFALNDGPVGLGIVSSEQRVPMQKLDIDVPDEYREHYIRQSKKTKVLVDRWLAGQSTDSISPPDDADDDTLTFAILTHLEPFQRPMFKNLLGVVESRPPSRTPASRAPTPLNLPESDLLTNTALAIQRLYRLASAPRAPESALYLLNNPHMHNVLATLAAVSDGEWQLLTSGRFDGFLRSGAEDVPTPAISRNPTPAAGRTSRGPTPAPQSSTPAPGSAGAPVAMDEETEIAVLAEVEREIYLGMEALEDAFEALHCKAEVVRRTLRERGAGLSMASQARRGGANMLEARLGTPASVAGGLRGWDSETDDGIDDCGSELAPDDSASNVSRSRVRRPKRRNERRTPAPVEEEEEEEAEEWGGAHRSTADWGGGRR